ncbi:multicopper oxidase domain-containing protein [Mesorhizobium sp. J428]|uniref:multicopper oxidase domain-containing protein n=1 Tax=Mesorhizobium sp. J428 TaxID=2898440 RepID=UPI0027E32848|nr:multicopper oxidase domain-containing protein [Mesorhizobium sp. J428]
MTSLSRRQFLASTAACGAASTLPTLLAPGVASAATPPLLRAEHRTIEVGGRAATVFGLAGPDGKPGLSLDAGRDFSVRLENGLDAPTLIHWHGLLPPYGQDGVPGPSAAAAKARRILRLRLSAEHTRYALDACPHAAGTAVARRAAGRR